MTERPVFVCERCEQRVTPRSYYALCPKCGGGLRSAPS
ncbi:hydrogenase maturation nickel metallochaperone HypA [Haloprofundus sp. MHR1]|nr:hydrogenase maturation nickel metallochaperone HypA [Haloprofundus sp. MHR1]